MTAAVAVETKLCLGMSLLQWRRWTCRACGKSIPAEDAFTVSGGKDARWNLQVLCEPCCDRILAADKQL